MPRSLRIKYEGACYHIISKGNEKQAIFIENRDYKHFLKIIGKLYDQYKFIIYAYALMKNHYHFFIETPLGNISSIMRELNGSYASYLNRRYDRIGHLFQGRYKSILVNRESYLLELSRYIHLNPVKAGIIDIPEKYEWSSLRYYLGDYDIKWLNKDLVLSYFKSSDRRAQESYLEFVYSKINIEDEIIYKNIIKHEGSKNSIDLELLAKLIVDHFSIKLEDLKSFKKKNNLARKFFILLALRYTFAKRKEIKRFLGQISIWGISKVVSRFLEEIKESKELQQDLKEITKHVLLGSDPKRT